MVQKPKIVPYRIATIKSYGAKSQKQQKGATARNNKT